MSRTALPTLTTEWASAWFAAYGRDYRIHPSMLKRHQDGALLPLVRHRRHPWRWELLSTRELSEPMDVLARDTSSIARLTDDLAGQGACLLLRRIPQTSPLVTALRTSYARWGAIRIDASPPSPILPLDPSWAEPERHLSKRRRSDLARALRRAQQFGEIRYDLVDPGDGHLDRHLDTFVAVEGSGWKGRARTALAWDSRQQHFLRSLAHALPPGELKLSFLRIDGQVASGQYAVHHAGSLWLLKTGYDERFARCSPGTLLLLRSVRDAAAAGTQSLEFLGTTEPWTERWTSHRRQYVRVRAYGRSAATLLCATEDSCRLAGSAVRRALPSSRPADAFPPPETGA